MAALTLADLFDTEYGDSPVEGVENRILHTYLHLTAAWYDHDDGWATSTASDHILTCKRCGALVSDSHAEGHLTWHQTWEVR